MVGTRPDYWAAKISRTQQRDAISHAALIENGWRVHVVWECELKDEAAVKARLIGFLGPRKSACDC
jgi:DNA mismatch endonuclease, patch repair protein